MSVNRNIRRIRKDYNDIMKCAPNWLKLECWNDRMDEWKVIIDGPEGTPYEGGKFTLKVTFPEDYPFKSPNVTMITKIYSPGIHPRTGEFCHPLLKPSLSGCKGDENWSPAKNALVIIEGLRNYLTFPFSKFLENPKGCCCQGYFGIMNWNLFEEIKANPDLFETRGREWTRLYAH